MIKTFCDCCEKEIARNMVSNRLMKNVKIAKATVKIEVMCGIGNTWNSGHLCSDCLHDAIHAAFEAEGIDA